MFCSIGHSRALVALKQKAVPISATHSTTDAVIEWEKETCT